MKTVTIEPFPHLSGLSIASVHPCKHSNVMKRFIERMDGGVRELQQRESAASGGGKKEEGKKEKGKWFGKSSGSGKKEKEEPKEDEVVVEGLRVDQYLVVFLKFMSSIGEFPSRLHTDRVLTMRRMILVPTIEVDSTTNIVSLCHFLPSLLCSSLTFRCLTQ